MSGGKLARRRKRSFARGDAGFPSIPSGARILSSNAGRLAKKVKAADLQSG